MGLSFKRGGICATVLNRGTDTQYFLIQPLTMPRLGAVAWLAAVAWLTQLKNET